MKKTIVTFAFGLLISLTAFAQSSIEKSAIRRTNESIVSIEKTIELSDTAKTTFFELKKEQVVNHITLAQKYKDSDPDKFKEKIKANRKDFNLKLNEALGKARAKEILTAERVNK